MFARVASGASAVALIVSSTAAPAASKLREPTAKWTVETQSNECLLVRPYGSPRNPLFLALSKAPMGAGANATILYNREWALFGNGTARIQFDSRDPIEASFGSRLLWNLSKEIKTLTMRSVVMGMETDSQRLLTDAATVTFDVPGELKVAFALTDHSLALKALDECATSLGVRWGYSIEEQRRIATPPRRDKGLGGLFTAADYPAAAQKAGRMGRAHVRLRVNDSGAITECSILRSSGSAELDNTTCRILNERAKFEPARDIDGKATRGVIVTAIQWIMM
ncbi:MAG: TonB family protein [Sphingomonas sp.]|nr:TonB family protein [Sphingomonas sp.]